MTRRMFFALPLLLLGTLALAATPTPPTPPPTPPGPEEPTEPPETLPTDPPEMVAGVAYLDGMPACRIWQDSPMQVCCTGAISGLPEGELTGFLEAAYLCPTADGTEVLSSGLGEGTPLTVAQGVQAFDLCSPVPPRDACSGDRRLTQDTQLSVKDADGTVVYQTRLVGLYY